MANQLKIIAPYWLDEIHTWVFDDARVGLVQEPFVFGADLFLSYLAKDIPDAGKGFRLIFSAAPFPGYQAEVRQVEGEMGGNWYESDDPPMKGWLCPALFKYFDSAPAEIYIKTEPLPKAAG